MRALLFYRQSDHQNMVTSELATKSFFGNKVTTTVQFLRDIIVFVWQNKFPQLLTTFIALDQYVSKDFIMAQ
jgi:hypothetical protein